ncbi:hypothetical protein LPJ60_001001 [Coemansia sp. RSA 2675]|nr:hypothetical protein LPJ60_001001 [Coemansia sp. RSA 2675]
MKFTSAIAVLVATVATASAATHGPTVGQDLCCAANQERARNGVPPLKWAPAIDVIARGQSEHQSRLGHTSHFGPAGKLYFLAGRLESVGFRYRTAAENVGGGFGNVDAVTTAWMNSGGHRAATLARHSTVCGGGVASGGYYTVNFASAMNKNDENGYYNLQCSGSKSLGAYNGDSPVPHRPQPPVAPKPPVQPPVAPKPPVQPQPKPPVQPQPKPPVQPQPPVQPPVKPPVGHKPPVQPPVQPQPPVAPGNGKCKRVPKGSIAAGKCKPCKQCGSKPSPFRR